MTMRFGSRTWRQVGAVALTAALAVSRVAAQAENGFVPAKPGDLVQEHLPATPLVFAAYAVVWVTLVVYVVSLWRRIAKAEREIATVAARLEARP
jgi:CcmD family protein